MPYTLKTNQISVKDPETGEYSGVDILAEQTEQGLIAELQAEGTTQVNRINQAAVDVQAAVDQAESDAATIISDTQTSINTLEAQKNTIAQTVASMAELGTDTTLSTPGMAADAGAVGDLSRQLSDVEENQIPELKESIYSMDNTIPSTSGKAIQVANNKVNVITSVSGYWKYLIAPVEKIYSDGVAVLQNSHLVGAENQNIPSVVYADSNLNVLGTPIYSAVFGPSLFLLSDAPEGTAYVGFCSDSDFTFAATSISIRISENEDKIADIEKRIGDRTELYLGKFVQGGYTGTDIVARTDRLVMNDVIAFPYANINSIKVNIANGYMIGLRVGENALNLPDNIYWFQDGDTIVIPSNAQYYRVCISHINETETITVDEYDSIHLRLTVDSHSTSTHEAQNSTIESARLNFPASGANDLTSNVIIAHTSDCHGDYTRAKNFFDLCDQLQLDLACITGDVTPYFVNNGMSWFSDLVNGSETKVAFCIGNHEVTGSSFTDEQTYNYAMEAIAEKIGNTTAKTFYYTDIADKEIRIISLNLYQYGASGARYNMHLSQDQIDFFCNALSSAPSGYGVLVLSHAPMVLPAETAQYNKFYQRVRKFNSINSDEITGTPIYDIIDSFIRRESISETYAQQGTPSSLIVSADFTNANAEFIAHLTGHFHQDTISYIPNTQEKQLMLNVTCGTSLYGGQSYPYLADLQDTGRWSNDATQDAYNVYVIDKEQKVVKVCRVGAYKTYDMTDRDFMIIPYAD